MKSSPLLDETLSLADVLERVGGVDPSRVRFRPYPGEATEKDVIRIQDRENRHFELVEGVLVEKTMGYVESLLTVRLARLLGNWIEERSLGLLAGADGAVRLMQGLVRIPDISFISWERLPGRKIPNAPLLKLAPDLAIEVLSPSNTRAEMKRKLREYFLAGVKQVWFVDGRKRTVRIYTSPEKSQLLSETDSLDGGEVLPGLALPLKQLFADLPTGGKKR